VEDLQGYEGNIEERQGEIPDLVEAGEDESRALGIEPKSAARIIAGIEPPQGELPQTFARDSLALYHRCSRVSTLFSRASIS